MFWLDSKVIAKYRSAVAGPSADPALLGPARVVDEEQASVTASICGNCQQLVPTLEESGLTAALHSSRALGIELQLIQRIVLE